MSTSGFHNMPLLRGKEKKKEKRGIPAMFSEAVAFSQAQASQMEEKKKEGEEKR